jgi:hypothetical protein
MDSVRAEYREILPNGRHGARVSSADDGYSGRVEIRRGTGEATPSTDRGTSAVPSRDRREAAPETVTVNDRRRVKLDDTERLNRVKRLEDAALRNGSILPF